MMMIGLPDPLYMLAGVEAVNWSKRSSLGQNLIECRVGRLNPNKRGWTAHRVPNALATKIGSFLVDGANRTEVKSQDSRGAGKVSP